MTSSKVELKRFLIKLALLALPFALYYSFAFAVLSKAGELSNPDEVLKRQLSEKILFGPAYYNPDKYYKLISTIERKPEILAIGTSRIMPIRDLFFKDRSKFYNAGGCAHHVGLYKTFLQQLPETSLPKIVIISCDQFHFNPEWLLNNDMTDPKTAFLNVKINPFSHVFINSKKLYTDFFSGKVDLKKLFNKNDSIVYVGFNAALRENGFTNDGSYHYGLVINNPKQGHDYQFSNSLFRIESRCCNFEPSNEVSQPSLQIMDDFLSYCSRKNIYVIGVMPPYAHSIYRKMIGSGNYDYLNKLYPTLTNLFNKYQFRVYDYTNQAKIGGREDAEVVDGSHSSEKAYLRIFIEIASQDSVLKPHVDIPYLEARLNKADTAAIDVFRFYE